MDLQKVERVYSNYAGVYDQIFGRIFHESRESAVRRLDVKPQERILEVGIGTGLSLDAYPSHCRVLGIDLSAEMLDHARAKMDPRRHGHIELRQMDALHMTFPDESFDFVMAFHVVTVVPDPQKLVEEMARVCKRDGQVVIINHFSSPRKVIRKVVNLVDPLTRRLGWSTRLSLDDAINGSPLALESRYKTSPWSLFTVVEARKSESEPLARH